MGRCPSNHKATPHTAVATKGNRNKKNGWMESQRKKRVEIRDKNDEDETIKKADKKEGKKESD